MEVSWDCTAHIMPYLRYLHAWLLKVNATMPNLAPAPELAAPVEVRIDHVLLQANQDRHELCENPQPHHQRVQKPRFHKGGGEPDAQTQEEGNPNDMSHLQRRSSGQHSHAVT